jgi:hypothetical protein
MEAFSYISSVLNVSSMDSSVLLINWVSSADMFTFDSISGPFLFGERICIPLRQHFTFNPSRMPNRSDAIHFAGRAIGDIH